jgi:hypothetical protein
MRPDRHHALGPPLLTFLVIVATRGVQCALVSSSMGGDVVHGDVVRGQVDSRLHERLETLWRQRIDPRLLRRARGVWGSVPTMDISRHNHHGPSWGVLSITNTLVKIPVSTAIGVPSSRPPHLNGLEQPLIPSGAPMSGRWGAHQILKLL